MSAANLIRYENEVFTTLVIDLLKQQRTEGKKEFLLDKYGVDGLTKERLKAWPGESS